MPSPLFSKTQETYSDILPDFDIHPVKHDLVRLVDEAAVKRALHNLLSTRKTTRFFNANLGAGIQQYLFEQVDDITATALKHEITQTITNYEPRVNLTAVNVTPNEEDNCYYVDIFFYLLNRSDPLSLSISLERLR